MSQRLTLGGLRADKRFTAVLNVCPEDDRLASWVSTFQERAWTMGRWWGTTSLMTFCLTTDSCLVLPREVALIEQAKLDDVPMNARNLWYSIAEPHAFMDSPYSPGCATGRCGCGCGCAPMNLTDKGTAVSFATTTGTDKKIRVYPGNAIDAGKKIVIQGYDSNGNWVRSTVGGVRIDGEQVTLALPFTDTVTVWAKGAPTGVIKDATQYRVLLYSVTNDAAQTEVQLADYAPAETLPLYRVMQIPGLNRCGASDCDRTKTLKTIVSLQSIPVSADLDWLLFTSLAAYKQGVMAEKFYEEGNIAMGDAYFFGAQRGARNNRGALRLTSGMGAIPLLQAELRKATGDLTTINPQFSSLNLQGFL